MAGAFLFFSLQAVASDLIRCRRRFTGLWSACSGQVYLVLLTWFSMIPVLRCCFAGVDGVGIFFVYYSPRVGRIPLGDEHASVLWHSNEECFIRNLLTELTGRQPPLVFKRGALHCSNGISSLMRMTFIV